MKNSLSNLPATIFFLGLLGVCIVLGLSLRYIDPTQEKKQPLDTVVNTATTAQPVRTNSWYSTVYKQFPTEPLFAHPGAYRFDERGLAFGFPVAVGTPKTVFGSFNPWCSLGMEAATTGVTVQRTGDWDITLEIASGNEPWQVHLMQGSPIITIDAFEGPLKIVCQGDVTALETDQGLILKRGDRTVLLEGKGVVTVEASQESDRSFSLLAHTKAYRLILLPPVTAQPLSFFASFPWTEVNDTRTRYERVDDTLRTQYQFLTEASRPVLTTLWPHHRLTQDLPILGEYQTQIGTLRLVQSTMFETNTPVSSLPTTFDPVQDPEQRERIRTALQNDLKTFRTDTPPQGVYFLGTWLGALSSVVQLADQYGFVSERETLLNLLQTNVMSSLDNFVYREDTQMMVAKNSEFGNDQGNDHHFHYGYYLRAGAILVSMRPELQSELAPVLGELAKDIATYDRQEERYPYLRSFSSYEGHSWADAYASFGDGNNQESTSEALNAWYGVYLWGKVTENQGLETIGRTLFDTELSGTRAYWFGEGNPFPKGYERSIASIVWGGKRDYATWFSGEAMHIHGIQWLPITPASEYLRTLPNFTERNQELLRAHPNPASHEWGDLYTAHLSYFEPQRAIELLPLAQQKRAMRSTALLLHTVYANLERVGAGR